MRKAHFKIEKILAYFSMEIALDPEMFTYSGGLGVLAGDTIRSCADLGVPIVAVTLLSKKGYFKQLISENGNQTEEYAEWQPEKFCKLLPQKASVMIEGREIWVQAWEYKIKGIEGDFVEIYLLDTDISKNKKEDREITSLLYGGGQDYRIKQEMILGIGGARLLKALGYEIKLYHMNEGHSAFLTLELLNKFKDQKVVREKCVFTTHTPVSSGHDQFPIEKVKSFFGNSSDQKLLGSLEKDGKLNMTLLGFKFSHYINGVAKKHGEVSQIMFPDYPINYITNGVHSREWTCPEFQRLFNEHIPGWMNDGYAFRYALGIPAEKIWHSHIEAKKSLFNYVENKTGKKMNHEVFTIGFARRSTAYKRADLLFNNISKLKEISKKYGKIQIVYAGKAHPNDIAGKELIKKIYRAINDLSGEIDAVYLPNYNMKMGKLLTSGVDVWLNTPQRPKEASGTSGMKACHNGVLNLSVLDGWWLEGHIEGITGWGIGTKQGESNDEKDAEDLYKKLEIIVPLYYTKREDWTKMMKQSIAFNASFFNTHRMVHQYVLNAYFK